MAARSTGCATLTSTARRGSSASSAAPTSAVVSAVLSSKHRRAARGYVGLQPLLRGSAASIAQGCSPYGVGLQPGDADEQRGGAWQQPMQL
eukprot:scaffold71990_cov65-Phaeocystis_antarctica.AAC.9